MITEHKAAIAIIGTGKVGTAMGYLLRKAGYPIEAISDQSLQIMESAIAFTGGIMCQDPSEAARKASCILITTGDDAIAAAAETIARDETLGPGKTVLHMSGAGGLDLLSAAARKGAHVGSIHPIQSFASVQVAIQNIPGSTFGITCQDEIRPMAVQMVTDLGGIPFFVREEDRPLYHAAACMAGNYLTTLMHTAVEMYRVLGLEESAAVRAYWPLVKGTLANIETQGAVQSLTGPIARGDAGTVAKHLQALQERLPELVEVYCSLGKKTIDIGLKKGSLSRDRAEIIHHMLSKGGA